MNASYCDRPIYACEGRHFCDNVFLFLISIISSFLKSDALTIYRKKKDRIEKNSMKGNKTNSKAKEDNQENEHVTSCSGVKWIRFAVTFV